MAELIRECKNNNVDKVRILLKNEYVDVNFKGYLTQIDLDYKDYKDYEDFEDFYVDENYSNEDLDYVTPLFLAYENRNLEMMKLLLTHGADPNVQLRNGGTILILASCFNEEDIVRFLLENRYTYINIYIKNDKNRSAINYCYSNKNVRMINILVSYSTYIRNHKIQIQFFIINISYTQKQI